MWCDRGHEACVRHLGGHSERGQQDGLHRHPRHDTDRLKGHSHQISDFCSKHSAWAAYYVYEQAKGFLVRLRFREDIRLQSSKFAFSDFANTRFSRISLQKRKMF